MLYMKKVVDLLQQRGLRERYLVMVGCAPISPEFAALVGADACASQAVEAVEKARALMAARGGRRP